MSQIKQNQIIPEKQKKPNPNVGFPRDFNSPTQIDTDSTQNSSSNTSITPMVEMDSVPMTPAILSVKEQIVIFNPDGSAKIDVILQVEDVSTAVEYDVRVTKNAGSV